MTDVIIAGIGQTDVGEHWDIPLRQLAFMAMDQALQEAAGLQPQAVFVGNMLAPQLSRQAHVGALLADYAHLNGIEAAAIEAGGASGGAALRAGTMAVASGMVDVALVVGVEKMTDTIGGEVDTALATSG
ncbi:MAG: thiolase family protein, partial [Chloroflexi bacterium]|nr:thiolase family protein [Chloroflexota bacterium]